MFTDCLVLFLKLSFVVSETKSGLAGKHSIDVGAGVIDAYYRGPVGVITLILISSYVMEVEDLDATVRCVGGFEASGV
ncbi:hypothetical protein NC652_033978 [Populus alba x Populus x berolinensis]|uniref:Uncharacterized protein n=1 Tax=Populus alba x Populus x berolinensis TaxID=444605 RepID=A0AAD6LUS3_9ROSI|nr:hypothetical protein NC652_033978 [Populus alba x Populus x berolinensis]KAJ6973678.1 hypothetical protein NC653_033883 [Populus alba x Populus x berolinensis]